MEFSVGVEPSVGVGPGAGLVPVEREIRGRKFRSRVWNPLYPKGLAENVRFRTKLLERAADDEELQESLRAICSEDILFLVNTFFWTYSPKEHPEYPDRPFVTWPFQDETLLLLNDAIENGQDVVIEKSRDMGASWMCLGVYMWRWLFRRMQSFLLVSRNEELVDKTGDPDCLYWKMDYAFDHVPTWMIGYKWREGRMKLSLVNLLNGSTIQGASTTSDTARGGRRTGVMMDEFAAVPDGEAMAKATRDVTKCRFFNSTHKGTRTAFYKLTRKTGLVKIALHWKIHPEKAAGLYYDSNGKPRSPWYDGECVRALNMREIAEELDMDPSASDYQFFNQETITRLIGENARPHLVEGFVDTAGFHVQEGGGLRLWIPMNDGGVPEEGEYFAGCDLAAGGVAEGSNSVLSVGIKGKKIAELAAFGISPYPFAEQVMPILYWFHEAFVAWEDNGPGHVFGRRLMELGYGRVFRRQEGTLGNVRGKVPKPGFSSTPQSKVALLAAYGAALGSGDYETPCREELEETLDYVFTNNTVQHSKSIRSTDPTGANANHGDRVISSALLWKMMKENTVPKIHHEKPIPESSFLWRRQQWQKTRRGEQRVWTF